MSYVCTYECRYISYYKRVTKKNEVPKVYIYVDAYTCRNILIRTYVGVHMYVCTQNIYLCTYIHTNTQYKHPQIVHEHDLIHTPYMLEQKISITICTCMHTPTSTQKYTSCIAQESIQTETIPSLPPP